MLSFAGVVLERPSAAVSEWVRQHLDQRFVRDFAPRTTLSQALQGIAFEAVLPRGPVEIGVLTWPRSASRFATAYVLASDAELAAMRQAVYQQGSPTPQPLVLSPALTVSMWLAGVRPLSQIGGAPGFNLLILVDDRWRWQFVAAAPSFTAGTTTWAQLYQSIASALGITLTVDPVAAAYPPPGAALAAPYQSLPLLLDAVAASCGQRITRGLDGSVRAWNAVSAQQQHTINLGIAPSPSPKVAGGLTPLQDLSGVLPQQVTVVFPTLNSGTADGTFTPYSVSLSSLALPELQGVVGFPGTKILRSTDTATWTGGTTPTNDTALSALARQVATDYYRWSSATHDAKLFGIASAWVPTPLDDLLEFTDVVAEISTRVRRGPWTDTLEDLSHYGTPASGQGAPTGDNCCPIVSSKPPSGTAPAGQFWLYLPSSSGTGTGSGSGQGNPQLYINTGGTCWAQIPMNPPVCSGSGSGTGTGTGTGSGSAVGGGTVGQPCCPNDFIPDTLHATFSNATGGCGCLNGVSCTLTWDSLSEVYKGAFTACGSSVTNLQMLCHSTGGGGYWWSMSGTGLCSFSSGAPASYQCAPPFQVIWTGLNIGPQCCSGTVTCTVTQ